MNNDSLADSVSKDFNYSTKQQSVGIQLSYMRLYVSPVLCNTASSYSVQINIVSAKFVRHIF